ncbi:MULTISPECIES: SIR2 family NAD-dependent protein deacylase [unclassified Pseudomonas]|uniref:SIR2 family NAD-dependent protein deacylase n=1 Tax=unclassified Pseudomonas TaxID=196821 RepID=UPI00384EA6A6
MPTPTQETAFTNAVNFLRTAKRVVIFTGAGVSAESGIPTFRDQLTGLWAQFDPAQLATETAFRKDPALVWGWYEWRRRLVIQAQPNAAHRAIAELARRIPELLLVTQNVDDLHERAGSHNVLHLHGSLQAPRCFACTRAYSLPLSAPPESPSALEPPRCPRCNGKIRPGVVWFGEALPQRALKTAFQAAQECDLLLSLGTSGVVQPAAQIPEIARRHGAQVVHINTEKVDAPDDLVLTGKAGECMTKLLGAAFADA